MAYTINLTNESVLTVVADGTLDSIASDIKLVGKNFSGYGEVINENLVHMLENFADITAPVTPLTGQIWWDSDSGVLNIYDGTQFKSISGTVVNITEPSGLVEGDLWWKETDNQLFVYNGTSFVLIGPAAPVGFGTSGTVVEVITDTSAVDHVVTLTYVAGTIIAIYSKDPTFTPQAPGVEGFAVIEPGINLVSITTVPSARFTGTATNSTLLDGLDSIQFLRSDAVAVNTVELKVQNDTGFRVGASDDLQLSVTGGNLVQIFNRTLGADMQIGATNNTGTPKPAFRIDPDAGDISLQANYRITELLDPVGSQDATTKSYVDTFIAGGWTLTDGANTATISGGDTLTINGTTNEVDVVVTPEVGGSEVVTIGLPSDVAIGNNLTVIGDITVFGPAQINNTLDVTGLATLATLQVTGTAGFTLGANFSAQKITNIADPTLAQDGATKNYVDGLTGNELLRDGSATMTGSFEPSSNDTFDFGTAIKKWSTIHATSFSGLATDSDLLDGLTSSQFLRSDVNTIANNDLTVFGAATFNSGADMTGDKIVNVLNPTIAQDAATKDYVDNEIAALDAATTFNVIPVGGIIMYNASFAAIPANFQLCDGTNGTPNMVDRFVFGTNTEVELLDSGGFADPSLPLHSHAAVFTGDALIPHTHTINTQTSSDLSTRFKIKEGNGEPSFSDYSTNSTSAGTPTGTVSINNVGIADPTGKNIPPFIKLAYIQRMS